MSNCPLNNYTLLQCLKFVSHFHIWPSEQDGVHKPYGFPFTEENTGAREEHKWLQRGHEPGNKGQGQTGVSGKAQGLDRTYQKPVSTRFCASCVSLVLPPDSSEPHVPYRKEGDMRYYFLPEVLIELNERITESLNTFPWHADDLQQQAL